MAKNNFNINILYLVNGVLIVYLLAVANINRGYAALVLGAVIIYAYYTFSTIPEGIGDPRERYEAAKRLPGGYNKLPMWDRIQNDDLQIERYKTLMMYVFVYRGERWGLALEQDGTINKLIPPSVAPLAMADLRNIIMNEAYGKDEKWTIDKLADEARKAGFRLTPIRYKGEAASVEGVS